MNILMQNIEIFIFDIYNTDKFSILHGAEKRNLGIHQILDFEQCKIIIYSKYFSVSVWLKSHAQATVDQI